MFIYGRIHPSVLLSFIVFFFCPCLFCSTLFLFSFICLYILFNCFGCSSFSICFSCLSFSIFRFSFVHVLVKFLVYFMSLCYAFVVRFVVRGLVVLKMQIIYNKGGHRTLYFFIFNIKLETYHNYAEF